MKKQLKRINVVMVVRLEKHGRYAIDEFMTYNRLLPEEYVNLAGDRFMSKTVFQLG